MKKTFNLGKLISSLSLHGNRGNCLQAIAIKMTEFLKECGYADADASAISNYGNIKVAGIQINTSVGSDYITLQSGKHIRSSLKLNCDLDFNKYKEKIAILVANEKEIAEKNKVSQSTVVICKSICDELRDHEMLAVIQKDYDITFLADDAMVKCYVCKKVNTKEIAINEGITIYFRLNGRSKLHVDKLVIQQHESADAITNIEKVIEYATEYSNFVNSYKGIAIEISKAFALVANKYVKAVE